MPPESPSPRKQREFEVFAYAPNLTAKQREAVQNLDIGTLVEELDRVQGKLDRLRFALSIFREGAKDA